MLFALGLVLVHALSIQASCLFSQTWPGDDIDALCAHKSVNLTTFAQLKQLAQAADDSVCCDNYLKRAITELSELVESGKNDLCSEDSIYDLRAYYSHYMDNSYEEIQNPLPRSLRKFVIAYGMQMSNLCTKNMIEVLSAEGQQVVNASDFEQLNALIEDGGPVAQVLDAVSNPGEVFLPGDLSPFLEKYNFKAADVRREKLVMQTTTASYVKQIQSACEDRFKPIYDPLLMPVVRLVNMGFAYKGKQLKTELTNANVSHAVSRWSRIVFLCEALANLRVVADNDKEEAPSSSVKILTEEEADAIEGASLMSEIKKRMPIEEVDNVSQKGEPRKKVTLDKDNKIYNKADNRLSKAMKSFKTNHSKKYRLMKFVTKRVFKLIKKLIKIQLRLNVFGFILSAAWKVIVRKVRKINNKPTKEIVESLNEIIEQQASDQQKREVTTNKDKKKKLNRKKVINIILGGITLLAAITLVVLGATGVIG